MKKMTIILITIAGIVLAAILGIFIGRHTAQQGKTSRENAAHTTETKHAVLQNDSSKENLSGKVYNLIILDESGSMSSVWKPALDGANETIQTIKSTQDAHPEQRQFLTFVSFSDKGGERFRVLIDNKPISEVVQLTQEDYYPSGNTPLWDAMGHSLTKLEKAVSDEDLVLVTIITDGYENASREYTGASINALVKRLTEKDWAFAYIGANQDAIEVAGRMGIKNALNFAADDEGTRAMWRKEKRSRERYYSRGRLMTTRQIMTGERKSGTPLRMVNMAIILEETLIMML